MNGCRGKLGIEEVVRLLSTGFTSQSHPKFSFSHDNTAHTSPFFFFL
jgi:hypothetical protein